MELKRAEDLARQATSILQQHKDVVLSKIMADGRVDEHECADVACNMVLGLRLDDFEPYEIAAGLLQMCVTVAELAEDAGGIKPGTAGELAKDAYPEALRRFAEKSEAL